MTSQYILIQPLGLASNDFHNVIPTSFFTIISLRITQTSWHICCSLNIHIISCFEAMVHICVKFLIIRNIFKCKFIFSNYAKGFCKNPGYMINGEIKDYQENGNGTIGKNIQFFKINKTDKKG